MSTSDWIIAQIDRCIPAPIRTGDDDHLRRTRLLVAFVLVIILPGPAYDVLLAIEGQYTVAAVCLASHIVVSASLAVLWVTGSTNAATHVVLAAVVGSLAVIIGVAGGVMGGAANTLVIVPLLAMLVANRRVAFGWLCGSGLVIAGYCVAELAGANFELEQTEDALTLNFSAGLFCIMWMVYGLGAAFDVAWTRAHEASAAREREVRRLLDHTGQGFLTVTRAGRITGPHSAILNCWLRPPEPDESLAAYLGTRDPHAGEVVALGFQALADGWLPDELILDQLPRKLRVGARILRLELRALPDSPHFLTVLSDITADVARERTAQLQREMAAVAERALADPRGLELLLNEGVRAMDRVRAGGTSALRALHTLKGNLAVYGLRSVADVCHDLEERVLDRSPGGPAALRQAEIDELEDVWGAFFARAELLVRRRQGYVEVPRAEVEALRDVVCANGDLGELLGRIDAWAQDPPEPTLERLAARARAQSVQLEKPEVDVHIDCDGQRTPGSWAPLWAAMVHAVTNAVDHGIEAPAQRAAAGKPEQGSILLSMRADGPDILVRVADDGAGIDWDALALAAARRGLPHTTEAELLDALFADRVSTRAETTTSSGRGVGMAALRDAVRDLGGRIDVRSVRGRGTTLEVRIPRAVPMPETKVA